MFLNLSPQLFTTIRVQQPLSSTTSARCQLSLRLPFDVALDCRHAYLEASAYRRFSLALFYRSDNTLS